MRTLTAFFLALFVLGCGARQSGSSEEFSPLVNGLHGRLILSGAGPFTVDLELENLGTTPLHVSVADPTSVSASLTDSAGKGVPPTGNYPAAQVAAQIIEIPPAGRHRHTVSTVQADATLALGGSTWKLSRGGRYQLIATWASRVDGGETPWTGTLQLPAVTINSF
ncbi:MAG TPA: hypothetical protein VGC42_18055 [Kofleriaceae bacterium]